MLILFIFILVPLAFYLLNINKYKLQNLIYFFKFLLFTLMVSCYSIIYIFYYFIFFVFKNYRFFTYYYQIAGVSKFYFKKKSIYFLFWKYLTVFIITNIYNVIIYLLYSIITYFKKNFYFSNAFIILLVNSKFLFLSDKIRQLMYLLYNFIIILSYHFFNLVNVNWIYLLINKFILHIRNNKEDPFLNRNKYLNFIDLINLSILKLNPKNLINFNFNLFKSLLKRYILSYIFLMLHNSDEWDFDKVQLFLLNIWIMQKFQLSKFTEIFNFIILCLFNFNVLLINFIYILLMTILNIIHIIFFYIWKYKYIYIYIFLFFIFLKYYWLIHYYFILLYKHYTLYLPIFELKESSRFFNFEWIDTTNYYDLVLLRNTLIDASIFNNSIYNDLLNNLSQTLHLYGFKITPQYNVAMYSALKNIYNKDTDLLNNIFKSFNENSSYDKYQWYIRMRKIFNSKIKSVFHYYKAKKGITKREKRLGEYHYNRVNSNTNSQYTRHFIERNFPITQNLKKKLGIYNYYTKGSYRKKISKKFVMLNLGNYLRVKKIPLRYTSIHYLDETNKRLIGIFKWLIENTERTDLAKAFYKRLKFGVNSFKKLYYQVDYDFFFGQYAAFEDYGATTKYMLYKHKIPTFNWTMSRWKRKVPNQSTIDFLYTATIDTEHPFMTYRDVPKKKVFFKRNFKIRFLNLQYPFSINNYYDIERTMSYFSSLNNIKIVKKYYYIYNTKLHFNTKFYIMTIESSKAFIRQFLYRLSVIKKPFNKLHFSFPKVKSKNKVHFWSFFDYMKTNKYLHTKYNNIYGKEHYINFYFIKRTRKSYIKLRNDLIRMYSLYFYYRNFQRVVTKNWWPDAFTSYEQNLRNQNRFDSLRMAWFSYIYLTNDRTNVKLLKNMRILNYLFRENFMAYHIYCDNNINFYNIAFHEKVDTYKLRVLNKISNLKRFFYFQNKRNSGWSIFKYLNVFSFKYHIKHFLWHNPYSFLIYKNKFLIKIEDYNINYLLLYSFNKNTIECNRYSIIFNLFLNNFQINDNILTIDNFLIDYELKNYFLFGNCNFYNSSDIEIYRLIMNFIFYYYKNFLYKLVRYRYILDYKNYTLFKFFKRYFNIVDWFNHWYFRFRWLIHKYMYFGNFIKKWYNKFFKFRYMYSYRVRRVAFLPFWFYFDNFTKMFMYIVLNKYYIKSNFIFHWFYVNYNFNLLYICIFFFNLKFLLLSKIIMYNKSFIKIKDFEIDLTILKNEILNFINISDIKDERLQYISKIFEFFINFFNAIYNKVIEFNYYALLDILYINLEHIYLLFNSYISKSSFVEVYIYLKWYISVIFKSYSIIWLNIIYTHINILLKLYYLNFNVKIALKLNNIIYIKYYLIKLLLYYLKIIFNVKNTLVYFKPNYYNFRQQKNLRFTKKFKVYLNSSFVSTRTVRNIYSFKHYTDNMRFLRNISFFNIYNYLYLMDSYDINLLNISTNVFIIFKNQSLIYIIFIYLFIYFFGFFLIFIIYRKFFNIYFFCKIVDNDLQDSWHKMFNNNTNTLLKTATKMKIKYFKHFWYYKKTNNIYNFLSFNLLMPKQSIIKKLLLKIFIKDKMYNKLKEKFNNNYIINIKNKKYLLDFSTMLYKIYDFMKLVNVRHFNVTKENKTYNFYFYNLLNSNTFNFCFFYWFIIIPYFFLEYIWMRYHLKGHIRIKRKYFLFVKLFLNNFKLYVQLSKFMGLNNYYTAHNRKLPRNYLNGTRLRRKRKLKFGYFFKWDRFSKTLVRLSTLGNYFYWFAHINKWEYFLSYKQYFFNFSYKSNYFYIIYVYIIFLILNFFNLKRNNKCRI